MKPKKKQVKSGASSKGQKARKGKVPAGLAAYNAARKARKGKLNSGLAAYNASRKSGTAAAASSGSKGAKKPKRKKTRNAMAPPPRRFTRGIKKTKSAARTQAATAKSTPHSASNFRILF